MDVVRAEQARGVTFENLKVGTAYVTGPRKEHVFLCVEVPHLSAIGVNGKNRKRLVRLSDSSVWCSDDWKTQEFAPVVAKVVVE